MANKGINRVTLVGNIGQDPELRKAGNTSVLNLSLATSESWKDNQGQTHEITDWHRVVIWGKLAEIIHQYTTTGNQLYVEGKSRTRPFKDSAGVDRYVTEVIVDKQGTVQMLGHKTPAT